MSADTAGILTTPDVDVVESGSTTSNQLHLPSSLQSEYLAAVDERRAFLTGFTGSAGTAVVTQTEACLWTDGRYHLQAAAEMDHNWTLMKDGQYRHIPTSSHV